MSSGSVSSVDVSMQSVISGTNVAALKQPERSDAVVSQSAPNEAGDKTTTSGVINRMVGRELQFVKSSMQNISDWRNDVDKRLSETASDLSEFKEDISSMNKKIDLILKLQMSGARSAAVASGDFEGITSSGARGMHNEAVNLHANSGSPNIPSLGERTCSASGISQETRFPDNGTCDASEFPKLFPL